MGKDTGKETKQKGIVQIIKMAKPKGKQTKPNKVDGNHKMGIAQWKETKQQKELRKILKWARLRVKKQNRTRNSAKY